MPYIKVEDRSKFEFVLSNFYRVLANKPVNMGDLNYLFTKILHDYLKEKGLNYQNINNVIGMLECCKLEMYRRLVGPYEDKKCNENGDVG